MVKEPGLIMETYTEQFKFPTHSTPTPAPITQFLLNKIPQPQALCVATVTVF